jgi:DNA sulfur modification protein DndB
MQIPVVIFAGITEDMERQLFHDLNNLAKRPTKSVSLKFDQSNYYTRLAKELSADNEYLEKYGVEMEKASLSHVNPNTFLLTTITNGIAFLLTGTDKTNPEILNEDNYDEVKQYVVDIINKVFEVLPSDINDADKYVMHKSPVWQGIMKFVYMAKFAGATEEEILEAIAETDFSVNAPWAELGARVENGNVSFIATGTGINAIVKHIGNKMEEKANA